MNEPRTIVMTRLPADLVVEIAEVVEEASRLGIPTIPPDRTKFIIRAVRLYLVTAKAELAREIAQLEPDTITINHDTNWSTLKDFEDDSVLKVSEVQRPGHAATYIGGSSGALGVLKGGQE